jgi:hypothetical protein
MKKALVFLASKNKRLVDPRTNAVCRMDIIADFFAEFFLFLA